VTDTTHDRRRSLADGRTIPTLALGVWQVPEGPECVDAVRWALEAGYRHIDTAQAYGNEASVGQALRESGVPRDEVFITTKFYPAREDPATELEGSLERLGIDFVDLYIVHWPLVPGAIWTMPRWGRSRSAWIGRRPRCSSAGASSTARSSCPSRRNGNASGATAPCSTFRLSDEEMAALDALDRTGATDTARESKWW
jgi:diketogulonate reductase-like aldo/keto reductase